MFRVGAVIPEFVPGLALALTIGLLIGFERGWQLRDEAPGQRVAGVRTHALLSLLGGLAGLAASGPLRWIALAIVVATVATLLMAHALDMRRDQIVSATGAVAALMAIFLGALATAGQAALAAAAGATLVAVLSVRKPLHALLRASSEEDVKAIVRLALVALLVLPLLPDVGMGPNASLNPRRLWLVVVVVGMVSFGGYALTRWLGSARGGLLGASVGAIVSSTAATLACARAIRRGEGVANQAGIAAASAIMLGRTLVLVALLVPLAFQEVALLVAPALLVALIATGLLVAVTVSADGAAAKSPSRPPSLSTAILFAALVGIVSLAAAWLERQMGTGSGAAVIAIGGMIDVDSAIAAIGIMPPDTISPRFASLAIAAPVAFNTLLKLGLTIGIAGWRRARWAVLALGAPLIAIAGAAANVVL